MENLAVNGEVYDRIFLHSDDYLVKYSTIPPKIWKRLKNKNLDFINVPDEIYYLTDEEKIQYNGDKSKIARELFDIPVESKILLPILKGYKSFNDENFTIHCDTENMLRLLMHHLNLLKRMHKKDIYHNDIYPNNIMINRELDIAFVDLDSLVIDDYISPENVYADDDDSFLVKVKKNCNDDKLDLLDMYMKYLEKGQFIYSTEERDSSQKIFLPKEIKDEIWAYFNDYDRDIAQNYYFEDIIEELLRLGYESPYLLNRKGIKMKKRSFGRK